MPNGFLSPLAIILLAAATLLTGCASSNAVRLELLAQHAELLSGASLHPDSQPLPPLASVDLLAVSDEMQAFLDKYIDGRNGDARKTELIVKYLLEDGLELKYSNLKTYTAARTFREREGNCLSFTNLFIALARAAGVNAHFQEVRLPPVWTAEGDTFYFNLHINALVKLHKREQIVDFDIQEFDTSLSRKRISDDAAAAQYYNNMGAYYLSQKDFSSAFRHTREAISLRPRTGYFWTNLGTILRRAGQLQQAEQAYLTAIELSKEYSAMSNLARLYRSQGRTELANKYRARVASFRRKNPYFLYSRAQQAYAEENFQNAQDLLRAAIRRNPDEHQFHRLQGLTWLKLSEPNKAKKSFARAAKTATQSEHAMLYERKLQLLAQTR